MKITKAKLKQIIKEELLKEGYESYKAGDLITLLAEADPEAEVVIKHRYAHTGEAYMVYDVTPSEEGGVIISIQEREV